MSLRALPTGVRTHRASPRALPRASHRASPRNSQQGAATLVVVMLLFFVISLTAAYTARSLIFEQRTSANQYRSSQAVEAAQAGLEWATTMLNAGRIDAACEPTADLTKNTFRQRYFNDPVYNLPINPVDGMVTRRFQSDGVSFLWAACQFDGTRWRCSCPDDGPPAVAAPVGAGPFPAFGVRFLLINNKPGLMRVEVNGCNSFDLPCVTRVNGALSTNCRATLCSLMALHNGLRLIPMAPVTARGSMQGTSLSVANTDVFSGGITIHTGLPSGVAFMPTLEGPSGTPPEQTRSENDSALQNVLEAEAVNCAPCMFTSVFGIRPSVYADQPALVSLDCTVACTTAQINAVIDAHPDRMVRLTGAGGAALDGATNIGSVGAPVVLWVQDGPVVLGGTYTGTVTGLIYTGNATLRSGTVRGAIVSSGDITANAPGAAQVNYDPAVLTQLMHTTGSFVRVPGSWRDFP